MIRVTVWNEYRHEKKNPKVAEIYPEGIHGAIAAHLNKQEGIKATTATLDEPEHGLTEEVLANTDVLTWWGHLAHDEVSDKIVDRIQKRVLEGMGLICLHSAHYSKIFKRMMGTTCLLTWRVGNDKERLWVTDPAHPIADGLPEHFELKNEEMYGEQFDVPQPDSLVFISWFTGGEVFRSGCAYHRGKGKIFYFRPGHETFPSYHDKTVLKVIGNAIRWAVPIKGPKLGDGLKHEPLEK